MNYGSPSGNPFNSPHQQQAPLARNYAETFNAADYECKDSIELESYARNLHNYLNTLLPQKPFPAFLFEKLEKRLDGITSILQKRSLASHGLTADKAKERLRALDQRLSGSTASDAISVPKITTPSGMLDEPSHPPKKRKYEAPCIKDVRDALQEQRERNRTVAETQCNSHMAWDNKAHANDKEETEEEED